MRLIVDTRDDHFKDDVVATFENERLEELFSAALEQKSWARQSSFLDEACAGDTALRSKLEQLLRAHDRVGSFLEGPPIDPNATIESTSQCEMTGTKIGRYKILQQLGEGGFGMVYMAEQEYPVRRKVALKIIKLGMDTKQVIARFEAERQALALMDHPNIAQVHDAGATESGRPYFVMELVKGIAITDYCDKQRLTTQQRLELFIPVCHAVQHAHQKGIIHRDIKPSNVLVMLHESQPVPKVIDFGIAKATSQRLTDKTLFTEFRQFLGTPEYMSPDQAEISGLDVDTRTDIYSLGVLLYELLTGTTPFDAKTLRSAGFDELKRIIREVEPPKPSARSHTRNTTSDVEAIAKLRQTEPAALWREIRGDLDWIAMKAMEKDRTRRYATALDLANDVERHLRYEPVEAGPPSATYKFRKFVRRHRLGVLTGSLIGVAIITGMSLATAGLIEATNAKNALKLERDAAREASYQADQARIREQRHRIRAEDSATEARNQAAKAVTVYEFLKEMLGAVDPSKALGREVTVRYILDEAVRKINEGALSEQPEVEAAVRMTLGETYETLGLYDDAERQLGITASMRGSLLGQEQADTLRSNRALAGVLRVKGKFAEAEALLSRTAETQRSVLGEEHPDTLTTMTELALTLRGGGRLKEAEAILRRTLKIQKRILGDEHVATVKSMVHLGAVCKSLGKCTEARPLLSSAVELSRRVLGEEHPCTAMAMNNMGSFFEDQRDYVQAEELYRQTYEMDCRVLGLDHPQTLILMNNLLRVLHTQGKIEESRPLVTENLTRLRRAAERSDADVLAMQAYAWELLNCEPADLRNPAEALPIAKRACELDGNRDATMLSTLAQAYHSVRNLEQAIATQQMAVARAEEGGAFNLEELKAGLVELHVENGDFVSAASVSFGDLTGRLGESLLTDSTPYASQVLESEAFMREGRFAEAATQLSGCLTLREKELPEGHWLIADTRSLLGEAMVGEGKYVGAEPLLLESYAEMKDNRQVPPDRKRRAIERIVRLYADWEKPDEALQWRQRLEETIFDGTSEE